MQSDEFSRRSLLKGGGAAIAGLSALQVAGPAGAFAGDGGGEVIPWLDPPPPNPEPDAVGQLLDWEALESWLTPADNFFTINHYGFPTVDPGTWRLSVDGLVARPLSLSLSDLMARPRREVECTLECSGNHGIPLLHRWDRQRPLGGHPVGAAARAAGLRRAATEVVF